MTDVPMTLLDLDATGLNIQQPAPPEFIRFLFDNSQAGYLTLWSAHLSEPDGGATIQHWLDDAMAVYYSRTLFTQMAPPGDKPAGETVTEVTYNGPTNTPAPTCRNVPAVTPFGPAAVDTILECTMGEWNYEPTSYAYAWRSDGAAVGTDLNTYTVADTDTGKSIDCVVTATNDGGSTTAPASNAIPVEAVGAGARREYPKK